jgi:hypothetical protein
MRQHSETGHARNAANFDKLISYLHELGDRYRPIAADLHLDALLAHSAELRRCMELVMQAKLRYDNASIARRDLYAGLKTLSTRIVNALRATGLPEGKEADAVALQRAIGGWPATKQRPIPDAAPRRRHSNSRLSFDSRAELFGRLVALACDNPNWHLVPGDLSAESLRQLLAALNETNHHAISAHQDYKMALHQRNHALYDPHAGVVQRSRMIKQYIKALEGVQAPIYRYLCKLQIKDLAYAT